ncbi:hypothetical protein MFLAVUS_004311 [Mucor flavus]|uniref:Transposase n=1 Tax=Mucor flavus TaxID=439312 RepID=A0ABP9YVJ7_9FUNG
MLWRTSACPLKTRTNYPAIIYPLKLCRQCLTGKDTDRNLLWDRDINAALNIRLILEDYINSGYNINSRHATLKRMRDPTLSSH